MALGDSNRGNGVWAQNAAMQAAQAQGALSESVGNYFDAKARLKQAKAELAQLDSWINYSKELEKKLATATEHCFQWQSSSTAWKRALKVLVDQNLSKMPKEEINAMFRRFLAEEDKKLGLGNERKLG